MLHCTNVYNESVERGNKEVHNTMDRNTRLYDNFDKLEQRTIQEILNIVYDALEERGYNAVDQMVGYILSGDPSYITSHNNARNIVGRIERDDLVEELIKSYLGK